MKTQQESKLEKALIRMEKSEDGYWASVEKLPGCYSFGKTVDAALGNIRKAIEEHISDLEETGTEVPELFLQPFELQIKYDLQTLFEAFNFINKSAFAQLAGINPSLLRQYTKGIAFASDKQKAKINQAIQSISHNLENACL
jgi:predicted RNase H-like HicB family nuclease